VVNLRISGIIAVAAFVLSFLIGTMSRASMPILIVRPLIFALLFFVVSALINMAVLRFLPELLEANQENESFDPVPGSRIDITEGDSPSSSIPSFMADSSEDGLGNISDLLQGGNAPPAQAGMDQNKTDGYNKAGEMVDFSGSPLEAPDPPSSSEMPPWTGVNFAGSTGTSAGGIQDAPSESPARDKALPEVFSGSEDVLPDLDSMAGAFSSFADEEEGDTIEYSVSTPSSKSSSSKNAPDWTGDFNPKDMAKGLQTVLKKDKEG
jgi:hypothetical protein